MEKNNEEVQKKVEVVFSDGSDLWTVLIDGELHYSSASKKACQGYAEKGGYGVFFKMTLRGKPVLSNRIFSRKERAEKYVADSVNLKLADETVIKPILIKVLE